MAVRPVAAIALLMSVCVLAACSGVKRDARSAAVAAPLAHGTAVIYLVRRKWHVDVGFAVDGLGEPLSTVSGHFPKAKYLFFGFGDRHYLLAKKRNAPVLLGALWPGPGLVLVTAIDGTPQAAFGPSQVIELEVPLTEALAAEGFVWRSIASMAYAPGPYDESLYFDAVPSYSALHTCNTWAAEALRAAGLPVRTRLVVFAGQLWSVALKLAPRTDGTGIPAPLAPAP
jgi:hypothetical protein